MLSTPHLHGISSESICSICPGMSETIPPRLLQSSIREEYSIWHEDHCFALHFFRLARIPICLLSACITSSRTDGRSVSSCVSWSRSTLQPGIAFILTCRYFPSSTLTLPNGSADGWVQENWTANFHTGKSSSQGHRLSSPSRWIFVGPILRNRTDDERRS